MAEERITETETPSGNIHTTHTVITEGRPRGGGSGWLIALVLVVAIGVGFYLFSQPSDSEVARDNAVTAAAQSVSKAAGKVGDAAQDAGAAANEAVDGD
ncbi:MAG: hypothetical protein JNJ92_10245 [Altererythrobacter sp.]|nr:hypothetical protein [Altererythrobacter sp.]